MHSPLHITYMGAQLQSLMHIACMLAQLQSLLHIVCMLVEPHAHYLHVSLAEKSFVHRAA